MPLRSKPQHTFPYTFRFASGAVWSVVLEGRYEAGCPATGWGGPPENYDPGEPSYCELERVLWGEKEPLTADQFQDWVVAEAGEEAAIELLAEAANQMARDYEDKNPPYPDDAPLPH